MNYNSIELEPNNQSDEEYKHYQSEYKRKSIHFNKENIFNHSIPTRPEIPTYSHSVPNLTDRLLLSPESPSEIEQEDRCMTKSGYICICSILYLILLISGFIVGNMLLVKQKNNCENNVPSIYTKVNITECDHYFLTCQYGNYTCKVDYGDNFSCNFPNNTVYIYISPNNKNCAKEYYFYSKDHCSDNLFLFNILLIIFGVGCFCVNLSTVNCNNNRHSRMRNIIK